ncbi:MAG: class I SAM-dependent methyltransferase [Desulfobacteraceae bacterium]|jgi:SAM-dependent methyltransferase|nr:class I SAM-dependent methyltransferase [Desulfobacteraceae bacterium]
MSDYYQKNSRQFFDQTVDIDSSLFLSSFVQTIPSQISILDVGCGSGRDLHWLRKQGFHVTGFERSPGLASLARNHSGCEVIEGDFATYDFSPHSFDAILASGSLVHVPHENLTTVLENIFQAFNQNPNHALYMYISLKAGNGVKKDSQNRIFYLWDDETLKPIFANHELHVIETSKSPSVKNSKDLWIGYILKKTI